MPRCDTLTHEVSVPSALKSQHGLTRRPKAKKRVTFALPEEATGPAAPSRDVLAPARLAQRRNAPPCRLALQQLTPGTTPRDLAEQRAEEARIDHALGAGLLLWSCSLVLSLVSAQIQPKSPGVSRAGEQLSAACLMAALGCVASLAMPTRVQERVHKCMSLRPLEV